MSAETVAATIAFLFDVVLVVLLVSVAQLIRTSSRVDDKRVKEFREQVRLAVLRSKGGVK